MKEITDLSVSELRLFPVDVIPLRALATASNLQKFTTPFLFKTIELAEDENHNIQAVKMQTGEFKLKEKIVPIEKLVIEQNRIIFKIHSDSEIADLLYRTISNSLVEIDPNMRFKDNNYLIKTSQTVCVVTLDVDCMDIFSEKTNRFINSDALKGCAASVNQMAKVTIVPRSITFNVNCEVTDKKLLDLGVMISTKPLTIEPRVGVSLSKKRFFTASPTDSKTHLGLIAAFENLFQRKSTQKKPKKTGR
jgi:hypothetical protein